MDGYGYPIKVGFILFPILAFLITLPYMIKTYHKYGSIHIFRSIIIYSFALYMLVAFFLVILPLPPISSVNVETAKEIVLDPLYIFKEIAKKTVFNISDPTTYLPSLRQHCFTEPFYNILLTIPFGFYLRYYFKKSKWEVIIYSFVLSCFFELTQLSGLFGIYPYPYRNFQVDDLILNTLGGLIGYGVLTPILSFILPSRDRIDETSILRGNRVSLLRRGVALFIDTVFGVFLYSLLSYIFLLEPSPGFYSIFMLLYLMVSAVITNGSSIGKLIVRIKVVNEKENKPSISQLLLRYLFRFMIYEESLIVIPWAFDIFKGSLTIYVILCIFIFIISIIYLDSLFYYKKNHKFVYETLTKTKLINMIGR